MTHFQIGAAVIIAVCFVVIAVTGTLSIINLIRADRNLRRWERRQ
jgi:hypothetical protein